MKLSVTDCRSYFTPNSHVRSSAKVFWLLVRVPLVLLLVRVPLVLLFRVPVLLLFRVPLV